MKKIFVWVLLLSVLGACQSLPTSSEWVARGDGYFADGKIEQALKAYNHAEQLNPGAINVYASRGAAYFFKGDYAAAQEDFVKVVQLNPYQESGYTALASALAAQGNYEQALEAVKIALVLNPNKPEILFTRAGIYFMQEKYPQAVQDYTAVLNVRPAADVYNARGAAYVKMGKQKLADADFAKAASGSVPEKLTTYRMID